MTLMEIFKDVDGRNPRSLMGNFDDITGKNRGH